MSENPLALPDARVRLHRTLSLSLLANHFPALHGLRVFAILGVLQFHVTSILCEDGILRLGSPLALVSMTFFFGMDLFFVLSGFLIGTIILHSLERRRLEVLRFYARRAFRIFPLYYVVLTALFWLAPFGELQRRNAAYEYAYLTNYVPQLTRTSTLMMWGWSLSVEEQFYLAVPMVLAALFLLRSHVARMSVLGGLWLTGLLVRLYVYRPDMSELLAFRSIYVPTHTRFDTLVAGIFLAYVHFHFRPTLTAMLERPRVRWAFIGVGGICFAALLGNHVGSPPLYHVFAWGTLTSVMYLVWIPVLIAGRGRVAALLSHHAFRQVATLGYGVYLIHMPIFSYLLLPIARRYLAAGATLWLVWPALLAALCALSLGGAYVLHLAVEKPALALRDRLT